MRHQIFLFNEKYSSHSNQSLRTQHFERFINWRLRAEAQTEQRRLREKNKTEEFGAKMDPRMKTRVLQKEGEAASLYRTGRGTLRRKPNGWL